jgi:hypothetical protein
LGKRLDDDIIPIDEALRLREEAFWVGDLDALGEIDELFMDDEVYEDAIDEIGRKLTIED